MRTFEFRKNTDFCLSVSVKPPNVWESTGFESTGCVSFIRCEDVAMGDFVQKLMAHSSDGLKSAIDLCQKIKWPHRGRAVGRKDS